MSAALVTVLANTFVVGHEIVAAIGPSPTTPWPARYDDLDAVLRTHVEGARAPGATFRFLARNREVRLTGHSRIGAYNLDQNGCVRWACFDLDGSGHKHPLADPTATMIALVMRARAVGHTVHVERSGGGAGWHVWLFFSEPVAAADVRAALLPLVPVDAALASGGVADVKQGHGIELFPKQDKLKPNKKGGQSVGSMVWLPYWSGAKPGGNVFYDVDGGHVLGVLPEPALTPTSLALIAAEAADRRAAACATTARSTPRPSTGTKAAARGGATTTNLGELTAALDAAVRANAGTVSRSGSTLRCNAWWRGGDGPNVHVDLAGGRWFDHKTGQGGIVRDFADILGLSLPQFLSTYGGLPLAIPAQSATSPLPATPPLFVDSDVSPLWERFVAHQYGPCGTCASCREDAPCAGRKNVARSWLSGSRGIPDDIVIDSGIVTLDRDSVLVAEGAGRRWFANKIAANGTAALVPLRNAESGVVENMVLRYLSPADPKLKSQNLPGVKLRAGTIPRGYGFASGALRADLVIVTEGLVDTLVAEAVVRSLSNVVVVGALSATEIETWARWLLGLNAEVIIAPHLDKSDAGDAHGTGQDYAVSAAAMLRSGGRHARLFRWSRVRTLLRARGVADVAARVRDLGDAAKLAAERRVTWDDVVAALRVGFGVCDE